MGELGRQQAALNEEYLYQEGPTCAPINSCPLPVLTGAGAAPVAGSPPLLSSPPHAGPRPLPRLRCNDSTYFRPTSNPSSCSCAPRLAAGRGANTAGRGPQTTRSAAGNSSLAHPDRQLKSLSCFLVPFRPVSRLRFGPRVEWRRRTGLGTSAPAGAKHASRPAPGWLARRAPRQMATIGHAVGRGSGTRMLIERAEICSGLAPGSLSLWSVGLSGSVELNASNALRTLGES